MKAGKLLAILLVLGLVGVAAFLFRNRFAPRDVEYTEVSPAAAEQAEAKLARLREKNEEVRLSGAALSSLLRYRYPQAVPAVLHEPRVLLVGDTARFAGRLATENLPSVGELDRVRMLLPDTSDVVVSGRLTRLPDGRASFEVGRVEVADIPIPEKFYPRVLERLRTSADGNLPGNAVAFRLPPEIGEARVEAGELVLTP